MEPGIFKLSTTFHLLYFETHIFILNTGFHFSRFRLAYPSYTKGSVSIFIQPYQWVCVPMLRNSKLFIRNIGFHLPCFGPHIFNHWVQDSNTLKFTHSSETVFHLPCFGLFQLSITQNVQFIHPNQSVPVPIFRTSYIQPKHWVPSPMF